MIPSTAYSNFFVLRQNMCYFYDNTNYVQLLIQMKAAIFVRPFRFGKTVLLDIYNWYIDIAEAGYYEYLFKVSYQFFMNTEKNLREPKYMK
jgi:hypothetical protein